MNHISDVIPVIHIHSLTWDGHKFLDNFRGDQVWLTTKEVALKYSSVSLGILNIVTEQTIATLINIQLTSPC